MTPHEAVKRIANLFPNKVSSEGIEDIIRYLQSVSFGADQAETFYETFVDNYEHQHRNFPTLRDVKRIWGDRGQERDFSDYSQYQVRDCIDRTKHFDVFRIVQGVDYIRSGGKCRHDDCKSSPCITQTMFVRTWEDLAQISCHLVDLEWETQRIRGYLERIKSSVIAGEEIEFNFDKHSGKLNVDMRDKRDFVGRTDRPMKHVGDVLPEQILFPEVTYDTTHD